MAGLDVIPRAEGLHCGAWVRPRSACASTSPLCTSIAVSKPPQSPTYNVLRNTDGADAIGPFRDVLQASVNRGTVATLSPEAPVGVPLIDTVPQYFGQPVARGTAGRVLIVGNGAAAVRSSSAIPPMTCFILLSRQPAFENVDNRTENSEACPLPRNAHQLQAELPRISFCTSSFIYKNTAFVRRVCAWGHDILAVVVEV